MALATCKIDKYIVFKSLETLNMGSSIVENIRGPQEYVYPI